MKRLITLALFVCASASAQTATFPSTVATDSQLKVAANDIRTSLRGAITVSQTTITVKDATGIVANMLLSCGDEIMSVASVSGDNVTVVRGYDGTTAVAHSNNRPVEGRITAWHHNALAAEVKSIENSLGANLTNITGGTLPVSSWDFTVTNGLEVSGANLLAPGLQVATITPCPKGLNFSVSANQYVYISGGTGTAEYAPLTSGGSCATGVSSGTIIFTTSNAHTGAWSISSSTDGIQEAINDAYPTRGIVELVPRVGGYVVAKNGLRLWPHVTLACKTPHLRFREPNYAAIEPETTGCVIQYGDSATAGTSTVPVIWAYSNTIIDGIGFINTLQPSAAVTTPTVFPPVIKLNDGGVGNNVTLRNLYTANAYVFIDGTPNHGLLRIEYVFGHPIYKGIAIDGAQSSDEIRHVKFTAAWDDTQVYAYPASAPNLQRWTIDNGLAIEIKVCDACVVDNVIVNGYYAGIRLDGSGVLGRSAYGSMTNIHTDSTRFGVQSINNTGNLGTGWYISGFTLAGTNFYDTASSAGSLYCDGCIITAQGGTLGISYTQQAHSIIASGNARLTLANLDIHQWSDSFQPLSLSGAADVMISNARWWKYGSSYAGHIAYQVGFTGPAVRCFSCTFDSIPFTQADGVGGIQTIVTGRDSDGPLNKIGLNGTPLTTGTAVASATTITATGQQFFVSGTTTVETLNVPSGLAAGGKVCAIPTGLWATNTAGNFGAATTAVVGKTVCWHYEPTGGKWWPSY